MPKRGKKWTLSKGELILALINVISAITTVNINSLRIRNYHNLNKNYSDPNGIKPYMISRHKIRGKRFIFFLIKNIHITFVKFFVVLSASIFFAFPQEVHKEPLKCSRLKTTCPTTVARLLLICGH